MQSQFEKAEKAFVITLGPQEILAGKLVVSIEIPPKIEEPLHSFHDTVLDKLFDELPSLGIFNMLLMLLWFHNYLISHIVE